MKARVKATGEIVRVLQTSNGDYEEFVTHNLYCPDEHAPIMISQVGGLWSEFAGAVLSEIQFGNLKTKIIVIRTQMTPKIC